MSSGSYRVLGIDPGTRHMGTAVLQGGELLHHSVIDVSGDGRRATLEATRRRVGILLDAYGPAELAIEQTFFARGPEASLLRLVTEEIMRLAASSGARVTAIAPTSVKKAVAGNGHASKRAVAAAVCKSWPQLRAFTGCGRLWKDRYHSNMFDAIAVAVVAASRRPARAHESTSSRGQLGGAQDDEF